MDSIVNEAEKYFCTLKRNPSLYNSGRKELSETLGNSLYRISAEFTEMGWTGKILILSNSGYLARMVSKYRPNIQSVVVSPNERTCREMSILWGIRSVHIPNNTDVQKNFLLAVEFALKQKIIEDTHVVVIGSCIYGTDSGVQSTMYDLSKIRSLMK
jgi:pyruvate kinase